MRPVARDGAERAAREFGERVMRDSLAAVEKKRNLVAAKNPRERLMVRVERADQHRAVTEPVAFVGADEFQDFARGEDGLGFGIGAVDEAEGRGWRMEDGG